MRFRQPAVVRGEGGQVIPLMTIILLVGVAALVALGRLAADVAGRAAAQSAADAVALAAAVDGEAAAQAVARANGAELVSQRTVAGFVQVHVRRSGRSAVATAHRHRGDPPPARAPPVRSRADGSARSDR